MAIVATASVRVKPDLTTFRKDLAAQLKGITATVTVGIKLDTGKATAQVDEFVKKNSKKKVTVQIDADAKKLDAASKSLDKFVKPFALISLGAVGFTAIQTVLQGIVPLLISAAGAALLIPGAMAAAGLAMVTVKLGADGIKKAFARLTPTLNTLKAAVSASFQSGLAPAVNNLKVIIPQLIPGFKGVASAISSVAVSFTSMLKSNANVVILRGLLSSTAAIIRNVGAALAPVGQAFLTIAGVAAGALAGLTGGFGAAATKFSAFVTASAKSGAIFNWIQGGLAALKTLGQIAAQVGHIVLAVFQGLSSGAGNLGGALLPALKAINTALSSGAGQKALQALGFAFSQLGQAVGKDLLGVLTAVLPLITGLLNFIGNHAQLVLTLAVGIFTMVKALSLAAAVTKVVIPLMTLLNIEMDANPIGAVVLAIEALIAVVILVIVYWKPIIAFFKTVGSAIASAFHVAIDWVVGAFHSTVSAITGFFGSIGTFFSGIGSSIASGFQAVVAFFVALPGRIGSFLVSLPAVIGNALLVALKFALTVVIQGIEWIIAEFIAFPIQVVQILINFGQAIGTFFSTTFVTWVQAFASWIVSVVQFFIDLPGKILAAVANFGAMIGAWITTSGVTLLTNLGSVIVSVVQFFIDLPGRVIQAVSNFGSNLGSWIRTSFSILVAALPGAFSAVGSFFSNLPSRILSALGNLGSLLLSAGGDLVRGLWAGIQAMASWLWDKVTGFVGGIVDKVKSLLKIFSPSRVMRDQVGKYIAQGIGVGIEAEAPFVYKKLDALASGISNQISGFGVGMSLSDQLAGTFNTAVAASASIVATPVVVNVSPNPEGIKDFINVQVDSNNRQIVRGAKAGTGGTTT